MLRPLDEHRRNFRRGPQHDYGDPLREERGAADGGEQPPDEQLPDGALVFRGVPLVYQGVQLIYRGGGG